MSSLRTALRSELEAANLFEYRPWAVYAKVVLLSALTFGFFYGVAASPWWWLDVPLFVAGVATSIGLVMIAHDSGHNAVSRNKLVNDLPGWLLFPMFAGLSLPYWRYKHNTLHHTHTNVVGRDPDVDIYPFAMTKDQRSPKPGFTSFVQRHQALMFWPLAILTGFAMRFDGMKFHFTTGRKVCKPRDRVIDFGCLAAHHALWLVVPTVVFGVPFVSALLFYVAWTACAGMLLAAIFLPAHMTLPLIKDYDDNFKLQLQTTQNLITNPVFSFLLIGLDHQVEHHLFQRMSHLNVKKASVIVRDFCARHDLPYHEQAWGAALVDCTKRLGKLPDEDPLDLLPPVAQKQAA